MVELILIVLLLWVLGIIQIPWLVLPNITILTLASIPITLHRVIIIIGIIWLTGIFKSPFRQMIWAFSILWILSILGIITVPSNLHLVVIAIISGFILSALQKKH